ncbi:MAG: SEL1-like repeat protein [Proteobacteria bacterium]|nr:SEL1-like repeat protein [Pseudomonadota bacterium]
MFISYFNKKILFFLFVVLFLLFDFKSATAESNTSLDFPFCNNVSFPQDLITAAHQGDAVAQFMVGASYLKGKGAKKDGRNAFEWFQKAANQGLAAAQFSLGKMYIEGKDIEKNNKHAFEWFQKAANQGHLEAQFSLGKMCAEGKGIEKNERKAVEWFEKAAEEGHGASRFFLGKMYADGQGVEKNEEKAVEWLTGAAEQGYPVEKSTRMPEAKYYSKAFKKLLQSFQSKKEMPFDANVRQLSSFADALSVLENLPSDALVIFDLDETLVIYRDESLPPVLTESFTPTLIRNLQEKGIKTIALTNSMTFLNPGDSSQEEFRYKELLKVGIDFSKSFQDFFIFNNLPLFEGHYPLLSKGIIYTNTIPKGEVLSAFLEKMKDSLKPSLIIFFDDRLHNILDIKKVAEEKNIKYIGFFYNRILNCLDEWMSYQEIQEKLLLSETFIPSKK